MLVYVGVLFEPLGCVLCWYVCVCRRLFEFMECVFKLCVFVCVDVCLGSWNVSSLGDLLNLWSACFVVHGSTSWFGSVLSQNMEKDCLTDSKNS